MNMREFIKLNRPTLDTYIQEAAPGSPKNDRERELWVNTDECLYHWAKREGVKLS